MSNYGFTVIDGDMKYIDPSGEVIDVAEAGSGVLFVTVTETNDGVTVDKTGKEIYTAITNKIPVYVYYENLGAMTLGAVWDDNPDDEIVAGADLYFNYFEGFDSGTLKTVYISLSGETAEIKTQYYDLSTLIEM